MADQELDRSIDAPIDRTIDPTIDTSLDATRELDLDETRAFAEAGVPTLRADMLTPVLTAVPGQPVTASVQVLNTTSVIETVQVRLLGIMPESMATSPRSITLFPDEAQQIDLELLFHPTLPAGVHEAVVVVAASSPGAVPSELPLTIEVPAAPGLAISVEPELRVAGRRTDFDALIENTGNTPLAVQVRATDADRKLAMYVNRPSIRLGVDQFVSATLLVRAKRHWTGAPLEHVITVTAEHEDHVATQDVRFRQKAILTAGVITILTLLFILVLWSAAMYFGVQAALQPEPPRKVVAASFMGGTGLDSLDPALVGGTVAGEVTASSTGQPLPRVTVEAFGMDGEIASATATDDDGVYELVGMLPSQYRLRIRADGYQTLWWPGTPVAEAAELVSVPPSEVADGRDIALTGLPGVLGGQAVIGEGESADVAVAVEAIDLQEPGELIQAEVDEEGLWSVTGLTTPATYRITFLAEGYAPIEVTQPLGGGEELVVNPTRLAAAPGGISGTVTDRSGSLLGGVEVIARRGDTEVTTVTPTAGEVGAFTLTDLETPGTYLVTFAAEGYAQETVAVRLEPGQSLEGFDVELAPATGTVVGRAVDSAGNDLGGVTVTVSGGGVEASADTFTTGDAGSYRISGLPLPGVYTVTFELDGYGRETQQVSLDRENPEVQASAALRRSVGRITGRVIDVDGDPIAGADVTVSDGAVARETTTASAPASQAGRFTFGDLPPGTYTVTARRPDGGSQTLLQTVTAAETSEIVLTVGSS